MGDKKELQILCKTIEGNLDAMDELAEWAETIPLNQEVEISTILVRDFNEIIQEDFDVSITIKALSEFAYVFEIGISDDGSEIEQFVECNWTISIDQRLTEELSYQLSVAFPSIDFTILENS